MARSHPPRRWQISNKPSSSQVTLMSRRNRTLLSVPPSPHPVTAAGTCHAYKKRSFKTRDTRRDEAFFCCVFNHRRVAVQLGYGKFHYLLLVVCGFVSTSEEMDVICMSFILPSAQCDLKLNTSSKGWLNSIIFIG